MTNAAAARKSKPASKFKVGEQVIYDGVFFQIIGMKQTGFGNTYKLGGRIGYVSEHLLSKPKK
ncbi:hypothetical protein [Parapedobacter sp. 2B3]|uniref:hypothetical protein n=1 Tax=Parapedobacter sp. 2B3 TaxID=3342381 RepID=UPI0035B60837